MTIGNVALEKLMVEFKCLCKCGSEMTVTAIPSCESDLRAVSFGLRQYTTR